jgi:proline iminopeptidase
VVALDLTKTNKLAVPLILFVGRHDRTVNSEVAATWFATVKAPEKQLVWFEDSGHMPMTEEPGKFLLSLVRYARPIARRPAT